MGPKNANNRRSAQVTDTQTHSGGLLDSGIWSAWNQISESSNFFFSVHLSISTIRNRLTNLTKRNVSILMTTET